MCLFVKAYLHMKSLSHARFDVSILQVNAFVFECVTLQTRTRQSHSPNIICIRDEFEIAEMAKLK